MCVWGEDVGVYVCVCDNVREGESTIVLVKRKFCDRLQMCTQGQFWTDR